MTNTKRYDLVKIGSRIREERKALGLSQTEFADLLAEQGCKLGRNTMSAIEKGQPTEKLSIDMLIAICSIFNCDIGYILCEKGYEEKTRTLTDVVKQTGLTATAIQGIFDIQYSDHLTASLMMHDLIEDDSKCYLLPFRNEVLNILLSNGDSFGKFLQAFYQFCIADTDDFSTTAVMTSMMISAICKIKEDNADAISRICPEAKPYNGY